MILLYTIAFFSMVIGLGAIFTLVEKFPVKILYLHYHYRKPTIWLIFTLTIFWQYISNGNRIPIHSIFPIGIIALAIVLTYKAHQSNWFKEMSFPRMTTDISTLPLSLDTQMAVIEYEGITKMYPLDFVIHHHIINDSFNEKTIALTYCAMCRSIIPFDVTEIGPLFVASFKNANMIVADKKTGTFFQQATFNSIVGELHPYSLNMIPFQILSLDQLIKSNYSLQVACVDKHDMRPFRLPIPGVWKKVMSSELTPGLSNKNKDFPSKTHVIGIFNSAEGKSVFYLKSEVLKGKKVINEELGFTLIAIGDTVNGFRNTLGNRKLNLVLVEQHKTGSLPLIIDLVSGTEWDISSKHVRGTVNSDLEKLAISDEYWFSWNKFHPKSKLIRLEKT